MRPLPGRTFGPYQIVNHLGTGGSGEVYRATDLRLMRDVAIKVLRDDIGIDSQRLAAFINEARAASLLNHPNIITIHEVDVKDSTPYIVMELVEGMTLRQLLADGTPRLGRLLEIGTQIADGLANAHDAGIVHRDLKPENLMLTESGRVKILDFGLAKLLKRPGDVTSEMSTSKTSVGELAGTVGYMSPEQLSGHSVDHRSDQFAFGIILYEMATGLHPFHRPTIAETLTAIMEADPEPVNRITGLIPRRLTILIERCLSKNPEKRFIDTRELMRQLETIQAEPITPDPKDVRCVIGVLPFTDLSTGNSLRFFSEGLTEELRSHLYMLPSVKLLSRYASARCETSRSHTDNLIEGSVRFSFGSVRVTVAMVDVRTEFAAWSAQYDRPLNDILGIQAEVASRIAAELRPFLSLAPSRDSMLRLPEPPAHREKCLVHASDFSS